MGKRRIASSVQNKCVSDSTIKDAAIVEKYRHNEIEQDELLKYVYEKYYNSLFSLARKGTTGINLTSDEVNDLVIDTIIKFLKRADQFDDKKGTLGSWLYAIMRYEMLHKRDKLKNESLRSLLVDDFETKSIAFQMPYAESFEDDVINQEIISKIKIAVDKYFSDEEKDIYYFKYDRGYQISRIAELMNMSSSQIVYKLSIIKNKIKAMLKEYNSVDTKGDDSDEQK